MMINDFVELIDEAPLRAISTTLKLEDTVSNMVVNVSGVPHASYLFNIIAGKAHPSLVKQGRYRQSCDKLLLIQNENSIDAYLIELKINLNPNENGIPIKACNQIVNTIPVLDYLISMIEINCYNGVENTIKINKYFVAIGTKATKTFNIQGIKPQAYYNRNYRGKKIRVIPSAPTISSAQTIPFASLK